MRRGVELPGDDPWHKAAVSGEHLVGADHREAVAESHDDAGVDAGELARQHHVSGHGRLRRATGVVVPVHAEQVEGTGLVRRHRPERPADGSGDQARLGELGEGRQQDLAFPEALDGAAVHRLVDDVVFASQGPHLHSSVFIGSRRPHRRCQPDLRSPSLLRLLRSSVLSDDFGRASRPTEDPPGDGDPPRAPPARAP